MNRVKTTEIKKKYKDKKTGEYKEIVINHAKVKDRIIKFWSENPRGKIETSSVRSGDSITFKTFILADKAEPYSKEATGHSFGNIGDEKAFEKLETISVGRALALFGYASDGEIASSEEMEEFESFKKQQKAEAKQLALETLNEAKTQAELKEIWGTLGNMVIEPDVIALKDELKLKLK
jgi:hypothetical protein